MKRNSIRAAAIAIGLAILPAMASAQSHHPVTLHVDPTWDECAFKLDPSLTQKAWRQFTGEAALVAYFRPLVDAKPMGKGNWEISALQWETGIDDTDAAWNDTFVHPNDTHWLFEGSGLSFPGLMVRRGMSDRMDAGVYFAKNVESNYGFAAGQLQYSLLPAAPKGWSAAVRLSGATLFGPEDLDLRIIGWDVLASREFAARGISISPYVGLSSYLSYAHEKSAAVDLSDEWVGDSQRMVGAVVKFSGVRIAAEYNSAKVNSKSLKLGFAF